MSRATAEKLETEQARVELRSGDVAFLDETEEGWKVSAAGCRPQPGEERSYDCELES